MHTPRDGQAPDLMDRIRRHLSVPVDPALQAGVADQQLNMVLAHMRVGTAVATAFALFLALKLRGSALTPTAIDAWIVVKLLVAGIRVGLTLRYERLGRPGGAAWRRTMDVWLLIDGVVWGVAGFALMSAPVPLASLVGAAMACVTCVATFGLQLSRRSTAAYAVPIITLTALGLLARGDDFGWIGGIGLLMLLAVQLATATRAEQRLIEGLLLRLRAEALADEKDEALKLALRQSAVKTQFLANISHELRTPLHGILGVARLLHLEAHDSAVARRVELIEASGTHLLGLINDLLDISRLEAGRFAMRNERFELVSQIDNLAGVYSVRAEDKNLLFQLNSNIARPCWVQGDPARLRQVLHNLLGNAVKFTQRGAVTLTLARDATSGLLRAEVRDTGPGIAEADLAHIFEAFRQAGSANAFEGAGLGLTIARDIAQAMGGDITIQSQPGVGTTLLFTAPLPAAPAAITEAALPLPGVGATALRPRHVLLAEDDDVNALIAIAYLELFGIRVQRAHDGREAVRYAFREGHRPDLVLMDCRMPNLDGLAATREIRAQELTLGLPRVPVIALTATAGDADRQQCLACGMDDFLAKPYTREQLSDVLARWSGLRPGTSAAAD